MRCIVRGTDPKSIGRAFSGAAVELALAGYPGFHLTPVTRHLLPNLRAVNFVIEGLLGQGVAAAARFDPQAKAVGEWLRARYLEIPEELL